MTGARAARLAVDLGMIVLALLALAYHLTGNTAHEWLGLAAYALLGVHAFLNRQWYKTLFRGGYSWKRSVFAAINLLLCLSVVALLASGLMLSRTVFPFVKTSDDFLVRQIHSLAAYWGLVLMGLHAGLHLGLLAHSVGAKSDNSGTQKKIVTAARILAALIFAAGVAASFDRGMASKLLLGLSFDFWDPSRPDVLFFAANLAIMGLYAVCAHYSLKALQRAFDKEKKSAAGSRGRREPGDECRLRP